ncbi:MAG: hypothetical protein GXP32_05905 [Kiritimatiellaeota bacterium]|nr:hypothetical protein [Kiritimatiellota bacterium]
MRRKREKGCLPLVVAVIVVAALSAAAFYVKKTYDATLDRIDKQISELPDFDEQATTKVLAEKLHLRYPVSAPEKTKKEIEKQARLQTKELTNAKFSSKRLALDINAILEKYKCVRRGDHVRFYLNTTRKFIYGTFQRILLERKDKFVIVDLDKYLFNDISSDYYYLFDKNLAGEMAARKVKEIKQKFKKSKNDFYENALNRIKAELYEQNGYVRKNGNWTSNYAILAERVANEKSDFNRAIQKKKNTILEKNQLFGLIPLTPREQKETSNVNENANKKHTGNQPGK